MTKNKRRQKRQTNSQNYTYKYWATRKQSKILKEAFYITYSWIVSHTNPSRRVDANPIFRTSTKFTNALGTSAWKMSNASLM